MTHYYNLYFKTFCSDTGIPCDRINKIAFLLISLNFADSHYFNHALISGIKVTTAQYGSTIHMTALKVMSPNKRTKINIECAVCHVTRRIHCCFTPAHIYILPNTVGSIRHVVCKP